MTVHDAKGLKGPANSAMSRRQLLRAGMGVAGAFSASGLLAACGSSAPTSSSGGGASKGAASAGSGTINVIGWSDYDAPGLKAPNIKAKWTPLSYTPESTRRPLKPARSTSPLRRR